MTATTERLDEDFAHRDEDPDGRVGAGSPFAVLLVLSGIAGLIASFMITTDKIKLLEAKVNGEIFIPGCSLNPVVSCGGVMESDQAAAFGFQNPIIGLVGFGVVLAIGAGVLAGARYRPWYWLGLHAGLLFGVVFASWLQYQSLYNIQKLCLWCCLAWVATIVPFCYVTVHNVKHRILPAPAALCRGLMEFHWVLPVIWLGVIGMLILTKWWDFWTS